TEARGGRFVDDGRGGLRYLASGAEPRIVAGSRSGLPILARGENQKPARYRYTPRFVTEARIAEARRQAYARGGASRLDFRRDLLPLIQLEVEHVYYTGHVRDRLGDRAADRFAARHVRIADEPPREPKHLLD